MTNQVYDYICSIGELIDKLSIENIKCSRFNHLILDERKKEKPNHNQISEWERLMRLAGEQRVRLKDELNRRLDDALRRGSISCTKEARTYNV